MDKRDLEYLLKDAALSPNIPVAELPEMDLYAEQVVSFTESKLSKAKRTDEEKLLTKKMINNYAHDGLIASPTNKKYNKDHLILLSLIIKLKNIISIKDIKALLQPVLANQESGELSLEEIYTAYLVIKEDTSHSLATGLETKLEKIKAQLGSCEKTDQDTAEWLLMALLIIDEANEYKKVAEKIIDKHLRNLIP